MSWRVLHGSALDVLPTLAAGSVQCVVTSPPYFGLRDYGTPGQLGLEPTPQAYVAALIAVFAQVWRVLRDDGTLWLNLGDSYNSAAGGGHSGILKTQAHHSYAEMIAVSGRVKKNTHLGGINAKNLLGIPWRVAFALQEAGWYLRSDIIWAKPNPMPESVRDRPTKAHEYVFLLTKRASYYYDADAIREEFQDVNHPVGSDGKFINPTAAGGVSANSWTPPVDSRFRTTALKREYNPLGRNARSVWELATQPYPEAHFATFPEALPERCIKAGSKPGDLILDPFCGAGTTGLVADRLARDFIGIDLNAAYCEMARRRIRELCPLFTEECADVRV